MNTIYLSSSAIRPTYSPHPRMDEQYLSSAGHLPRARMSQLTCYLARKKLDSTQLSTLQPSPNIRLQALLSLRASSFLPSLSSTHLTHFTTLTSPHSAHLSPQHCITTAPDTINNIFDNLMQLLRWRPYMSSSRNCSSTSFPPSVCHDTS